MTQSGSNRRRCGGRRSAWFVAIGLAALHLAVAAFTPISVRAAAVHDDGLFLARAQSLVAGEWLGPYDEFTLMKGPAYPIFLAISSVTGTSVAISTALLRILAASVLSMAVARVVSAPRLALPMFALVLWNPVATSGPLLRVIRDSISSELLLISIGLAVAAFWIADRASKRAALAGFAGVAGGAFWLTREDGIWAVPGFLLVVAVAGLARPRSRRGLVIGLSACMLGGGLVVLGFRTINFVNYGAFVGVDFHERGFSAAVRALQSVRDPPPIPYVPVSRAARARIYAVSPSFASLSRSLDPPKGATWQRGCEIYPWTCGEIAGGWFVWALRQAVAKEGHYDTPQRAGAFYARLAAEVRDACRSGALSCEENLLGFMPAVERAQWRSAPSRAATAIRLLSYRARPALDPGASEGSRRRLDAALGLLGRPLAEPRPNLRLKLEGDRGSSEASWFEAALDRPREERSPPLRRSRGGRLKLVVGESDLASATLRLRSFDGIPVSVPIADLSRGETRIPVGDSRVVASFDDRRVEEHPPRVATARRIRAAVLELYAVAMPLLLAGGVLSFLLAAGQALRRGRLDTALGLAAAFWTLVVGRIALLVLVDLSAFPAVTPQYLAPAYPLAMSAALLSYVAARTAYRGHGIES